MIDFIKILVIGINSEELRQNPLLSFSCSVDEDTSEIVSSSKAEFKGLLFEIKRSGSVFISGSLHKYWNNGKHNYNDFDINALDEVLTELKQLFGIDPDQMILKQIEFGVNFIPPRPTEELLLYCFLHSTKPFERKFNSDEGRYIQVEHRQYIIKIYDKARHYRSKGFKVPHPEIMRFEIKFKKLERLKRLAIISIKDLLHVGLENFVPLLVKEWEKVLFYDKTIQCNSKSLFNYSNNIYWQELTKRDSAFRKHRAKLKTLIKNHSENLPQQIEDCILQKGIELTKEGNGFDQKKELAKIREGNGIDTLNIRSNPSPGEIQKKRFCRVTGIDISMQKDSSILLSHIGLKHLHEINKKEYEIIKRRFLTDNWIGTDFQIEIKEIAHNIRNTISNQRIKQKRIYPENQFRLFDIKLHELHTQKGENLKPRNTYK